MAKSGLERKKSVKTEDKPSLTDEMLVDLYSNKKYTIRQILLEYKEDGESFGERLLRLGVNIRGNYKITLSKVTKQEKTLEDIKTMFHISAGDILKSGKHKYKVIEIYPYHILTEFTNKYGARIKRSFTYAELFMARKKG